jgi:protoheme IX farnesyltransferase
MYGIGGIVSAIIVGLSGLAVLAYSIQLFRTHDEKMASKLMFSTFFYLPIVQIAYLFSF